MFWNKKKTAPKEKKQEETKKPLPCGDLYQGESVTQIALAYGKNREEAEEMGYNLEIETEWNGNSVFTRDDAELNADGDVFDVNVELIDGEEEEE